MIYKSETLGKLMDALLRAQLEFDPVLKDTKNPLYGSKYANLAGVVDATQPALSKNGLVISQLAISDVEHQGSGVATILAHTSGEYIGSDFMLPAAGRGKDNTSRYDAQTACGAVTYSRRYAYLAILGVAAEDDDGSFAAPHNAPAPVVRKTAAPKQVSAAPAQEMGSRPQEQSKDLQPPKQSAVQPTKAQVPNAAPVAPSTIAASPQPSASAPSMGVMPNEAEMTAFRQMFAALDNNLTAAGLKPSRGLRTGHKIRNYILKTVGVPTTDQVTKAQWATFFQLMAQAMSTPEGTQQLVQMIESPEGK